MAALNKNYVLVMISRSNQQKASSYYIVQFDVRAQPYQTVEIQCPGIMCEYDSNYINYRNYAIISFPKLNQFCYSGRCTSQKDKEISIIRFHYPLTSSSCFKVSKISRLDDKNKNSLKFVKLNNVSLVGWIPFNII